jgi:hypothetical protein
MRIGSLQNGPNGELPRGFDANRPIDARSAKQAALMGYRFAVRYIRRAPVNPKDITAGELAGLLEAGLAVMLVQHVASESLWRPSRMLGDRYGATAAEECRKVGLPLGVTVWLDLEGVAPGVTPGDVIQYANAWHAQVAEAGYRPGLYVGWHAVLSADQLYRNLRFDGYWSAFNLDRDKYPAVRGVQMRQRVAKTTDRFPLVQFDSDFDVNVIQSDAFGDRPSLLIPSPQPLA